MNVSWLAFLRPAGLCGSPRHLAALPAGHRFESALAPDPSALPAHLGHDLRNQGGMGWSGGRLGRVNLAHGGEYHAPSVLNGIKARRTLRSASSLWHTSTVARVAVARQVGGSTVGGSN